MNGMHMLSKQLNVQNAKLTLLIILGYNQRRAEASKALLKTFSLCFIFCWVLRYYRGIVCLIGNIPQLFECKKPVRAK